MAIANASLIKNVKPVAPELLSGDLIPQGHPLFGIIWINPERLSGTPCFYGTRVPIRNLFDYIEGGSTLNDFVEGFPGISHEQAVAVLEIARSGLLAKLPRR
jgi:uncharacterized protein (DUF433 family)